MNRICLTSIAVLGMTLTSQVLAESEKPNVLFLIADDLNTALSGFGHKQCKTPNLDRLAERGVKFENMHCQYPVCGASRASIMSGLYPYSNLKPGNAGTLRGSMPNVVVLWGSAQPGLRGCNHGRSGRHGRQYLRESQHNPSGRI
jgi:iduronate 2-sulfatase